MPQPSRNFNATGALDYRYGFNGKENDNEMKGEATQVDYGMRIYDSRIGRFLSVDPLTPKYPELTPYQFASNTPIQAMDLDGMERLDMTAVNANKRSATIRIVKQVDIVKNGLINELKALNSSDFSKIFSKGNTTLYTSSLPTNGQPMDFITQEEYENGKGYQLNVVYDIKLNYIKNMSESQHSLPERSVVFMAGANIRFSGKDAFATSGTASNDVAVNPNFMGFSTNDGAIINETYEELIAHEVGFHNMIGLNHRPDLQGNAIYPSTSTLESNLHNKVLPTLSDTKKLLQKNITERQNLNVIPSSSNGSGNTESVPELKMFLKI